MLWLYVFSFLVPEQRQFRLVDEIDVKIHMYFGDAASRLIVNYCKCLFITIAFQINCFRPSGEDCYRREWISCSGCEIIKGTPLIIIIIMIHGAAEAVVPNWKPPALLQPLSYHYGRLQQPQQR